MSSRLDPSAAVRRPRQRVIQISDPHLVADGPLYADIDPGERVQAIFDALVAANWEVDVVVLSGDLADRGEAVAYERLKAVVDQGLHRLGAQALIVPGNHDDVGLVRSIMLGASAGDGPLDSVVRVGGLRLVGLDSTVPGVDFGALSDAQLRWLADELAEPAPEGTILVVHHPPIWSTNPHSELMALRAPERLGEAIRGTDVLVVLGGHTHRASAGTLAGIPVWVSPAIASVADPLYRRGFRGYPGGGFSCVDVLGPGELVTTYVPLASRDGAYYETVIEE
jgi:3',5'-cyclic AMP phosphodiesterase CpdA